MSLNVVALAGSPRARSFTHRLLEAFLEGTGEGTAVERFDLRELKINACQGCFACWFVTPGRCAQEDDFPRVAASLDRADAVILAAPLYFDGLPGPVKTLLDRCVCGVEPYFSVDRQGRSVHRSNRLLAGGSRQAAVLISTCGFPELANFAPLEEHFRAICRNASWDEGGSLLVAGAGFLDPAGRRQEVLDLAARAGEGFAVARHIPAAVQQRMRGPWVDAAAARQAMNHFFARRLGHERPPPD
ncbi:MAG: flavodoxin family protein [bacterium]|nr:flavodoxin family protein [bacterium]